MGIRGGSSKSERQAFRSGDGGSKPTPSLQVSDLWFEECEYNDIKQFVIDHHYSHNLNGVKIGHCFAARHHGVLVCAIVYGAMSTTAWRKFAKRESKVIELRRLVCVDEMGKNAESKFIGWTLRWLKKNAPKIEVVVSYADPAHGHEGVVYKASNFEYMGVSGGDSGFLDPESGKTYHSRTLRNRDEHGEYKPFVKRLRRKLLRGELTKVDLPGKHCYRFALKPGRAGALRVLAHTLRGLTLVAKEFGFDDWLYKIDAIASDVEHHIGVREGRTEY